MERKKGDSSVFSLKVLENIFFQGISGISAKVGSLIFTIIVARILFPDMFGIYSLALTIILTLVTISDFGLSGAITRYTTESLGNKNKKKARSQFWFLLRIKLVIAILVSIALFLSAGLIASFFKKPELLIPLKIGSVYIITDAIYTTLTPIFLSVQKLKYTALSEYLSQFSRIVLLLFFLLVLKYPINIPLISIIIISSMILAILFDWIIIAKKYPFLIKGESVPVERKRMLKFSSIIAVSALGVMIFANIDKIVLGFYLDAEFIGFYSAIITMISGVIGLISIGSVFFPIFIQLKGRRLKETFQKSFHYISIITFPTTIGLAFVIIPAIKILYGVEYVPPQYESALIVTSILLSLLILESIFSGFYKVLFDAREMPEVPSSINIIASVLNIILNIIFISFLVKINPVLGLVGAAFATFLTRFGGLAMLFIISGKKLSIYPPKDSLNKPLIASMIMLLYLFIFKKLFSLNIISGIIMIVSAAIIYIISIIMIKGIILNDIKEIFLKVKT